MATFTNIQTSKVGQALLAEVHAGTEQLTITGIAFGSGIWTEEEYAARDLTGLKNEVLRVAPSGGEQAGGVADITCVLTNAALETGFALTELGVIAKKADDTEVLYMVDSVLAAKSTWISPASDHLMQIPVELRIACSSTSQINIRIESTAPVTSADLEKHNNSAEAHPPLQAHITDKSDPHGTIPADGETGQVLIKQEDGSIAWGTVAGVPVGELCFSTNGEALPGTIPANVKQKILCSLVPQLFEWMKGGTYLTDEAAWDAEATAQDGTCGKYCWDGGEYFILPCYTKYFAAAHGDKAAGDWAGDAIRNITGKISGTLEAFTAINEEDVVQSGALSLSDPSSSNGGLGSGRGMKSINLDTSNVVPTAEENRPKTAYVLPCIKAFDIAINAAQIDMQALAQQVAAINGNKVDRSEWVELVPEKAYKRPDGIIEQYGMVQTDLETSPPIVTLPAAFLNDTYKVFVTISVPNTTVGNMSAYAQNISPTQFKILTDGYGTPTLPNITVNWFAVGK